MSITSLHEGNTSWPVSGVRLNVFKSLAGTNDPFVGAVRRILKIQLGTKLVTRSDMEELRSILLDLQVKLKSIVNRIPEVGPSDASSLSSTSPAALSYRSPADGRPSDTELPGEGPMQCAEQYHSPVLVAFHKWARILLSLFIDKVMRPSHRMYCSE